MFREIPIAHTPEVRQDEELKGALETENLVFEYKVKKEEELSIFDEVKEYLTYESVVDSDVFSSFSPETQQLLTSRLQKRTIEDAEGKPTEIRPIRRKAPLLYEDFKTIWGEDKKIFLKILFKAVGEVEKRKIEKVTDKTRLKSEGAKIKKDVENRTIGKTVRLANLLKHRYDVVLGELGNLKEEDLLKIKAYGRANRKGVTQALSEIKALTEGLSIAKGGKSTESIKSSGELARMYGVSEEETADFNSILEEVFEEETGRKVALSVETKYDSIGNIVDKDFIAAYVNYHRELENMHDLLNRGKIVETAEIKDLIERALPALQKNPPTIVYFHGDFGTGKTALATHIARTRFGKEPIVVAGSKYLDPDRFTEEFRLQKLSSTDFLNQIAKSLGEKEVFDDNTSIDVILGSLIGKKGELKEKALEAWLRDGYTHELKPGENFNEEDFVAYKELHKEDLPDQIKKDIESEVDSLFSNSVQGRYILGAMYEAMRDGRPLIIDEANAISPEVLIAFNDLLTKEIGERIKVRADEGEITIKEGYCVMWTGNTGERYKQARFNDMDPAAYSRLVPIPVRYLPQSREITNMASLMSRLELDKLSDKVAGMTKESDILDLIKDSKEKAGTDQIFQVLLLKLMNDRLGAELLVKKEDPYSVFKDVYKLALGARIIMDIFEGHLQNFPTFPNLTSIINASTALEIQKEVKKSNLTMRELIDNIIGAYMDSGGGMDIEFYLWGFVKKYDQYPKEQAIIYAILNKVGFFQKDEAWPDYETANSLEEFRDKLAFNPLDGVKKYKKIQKNGEYFSLLNTEGHYRLQYFSSLETMQLMFGFLPPRKKEEYQGIIEEEKKMFETDEVDDKIRGLIKSIREVIGSYSPDLFKTAAEAKELRKQTKPHIEKLLDQDFVNTATDEEFIGEVEGFANVLLKFLVDSGNISEEEYDSTKEMDTEEKMNFITGVLKEKK